MRFKLCVCIFAVVLTCISCATAKNNDDMTLWFQQPADRWIEGLPLGNGRVGIVVFGGVGKEQLALNESTFWSGAPSRTNVVEGAHEQLDGIRQMLFDNKYKEAIDEISKYMLGRKNNYGTHLPVGDLWIEVDHGNKQYTDYYRRLDMDRAVSLVEYSIDGVKYTREAFVSNVTGTAVIRLSADRPGMISFKTRFTTDINYSPRCETENNNTLIFTADARERMHSDGKTGTSLYGMVKVLNRAGKVSADAGAIQVSKADAATLLIALNTNYKGKNPKAETSRQIAASALRYERLLTDHIRDHQSLFHRVSIALGSPSASDKPTDLRRERYEQGNPDPQLESQFFQYGRYLVIAGSRSDSPLPTNLQGIWNDGLACKMQWTCDFHLDINTQQNYWPCGPCNLSECEAPLFDLIDSFIPSGRHTANALYGCAGWVCHVFTNAWGYTAPGWGLGWGIHPSGGIWIASHLWEHYRFSGDEEFLKQRAYPVLKEAAEFFLDYLVLHPKHGYLVSGPSVSPENAFFAPDGFRCAESMGAVHDTVVIADLFASCIKASEILGFDADFRRQLKTARAKLPPLMIGKHGQLQEWLEDFEEAVPNHRHTSHLVALFPGSTISPQETPALAKAARIAIERRLRQPDWEDVEWSRANAINYYARLRDGDAAHESIVGLIAKLTEDNLMTFSAAGIAGARNNIFVMDGNAAASAGMAEMLLQSHENQITLLPALPQAWPTGSVKGLRARNGFEIDINWKDMKLVSAKIKSLLGADCTVRYKNKEVKLKIDKGEASLVGM